MNVSIEYNGNNYEFPLWTNKLEKEILLSATKSSTVEQNMNNMFGIINNYPELQNIHYLDKLYIFLKCREYSVGNIVENMIVCQKCNNPQHLQYKISNNTVFKTTPPNLQTEYGIVTWKNSQAYLNDVMVEDITDLNVLVNLNNNYLKKISHELYISYKHTCHCGGVNQVIHTSDEILHDIVLSIEVGELYKYYTNMQYNYRLSYSDIDNMFSFERNIYKSLYDSIEKDSKNKQS